MKSLWGLLLLLLYVGLGFTFVYSDVVQNYEQTPLFIGKYNQQSAYLSSNAVLSSTYPDKFYSTSVDFHPFFWTMHYDQQVVGLISLLVLTILLFVLLSKHQVKHRLRILTIFLFLTLGGPLTLSLLWIPILVILCFVLFSLVLLQTRGWFLGYLLNLYLAFYEPMFSLVGLLYYLLYARANRATKIVFTVVHGLVMLLYALQTHSMVASILEYSYQSPYFFIFGGASGFSILFLVVAGVISVFNYKKKSRNFYRVLLLCAVLVLLHPVFFVFLNLLLAFSLATFVLDGNHSWKFPLTREILIIGIFCCMYLSLVFQLQGIEMQSPTSDQVVILEQLQPGDKIVASPDFTALAESVGIVGQTASFVDPDRTLFTPIDAPTYYSFLVSENVDYIVYDDFVSSYKNQTYSGLQQILSLPLYFNKTAESGSISLWKVLID